MTVIARLLLALAFPAALPAQVPADLARERAEFATWLTSARNSPYASVAHAPLGRGLVFGPADADVPLPGIGRARITEEDGVVRLTSSAGARPIPRYREVTLGAYRVVVGGEPGRLTVTVFGALRDPRPPAYYPYSAAAVFVGALTPPAQARRQRMLALDGIEVEATHAGTFPVRFGRNETRLTVYRIPEAGTEESELMIYFRDSTNAQGTYPAGRFVPLVPLGDGRYRLDFNRARNPFCAYSTVYACPVPWPGNTIPARVEAGERYATHSPAGSWRAVLDLAGGSLRFRIEAERAADGWRGRLCNGPSCDPFSAVRVAGDSVVLEMADYAAAITARLGADSLTGSYRNVGSRGPRSIPFRASRGAWPVEAPPAWLLGRWDAWFESDGRLTPRVFEFRRAPAGLEGTIVSNSGDYGLFWGRADTDSFSIAHFDGSFVYMLTGRLDADTLRGIFHAGLRTQTPFVAARSRGGPHLTSPAEVVRADTLGRFRFSFPDLDGRVVSERDPRFRDKVVVVTILGTWCPTCHDAEPALVGLYHRYRDRGLEMVGLAYEVTGDTATDAGLVRRFRDKFGVPFPILLAGTSDAAAAAATQPQLSGPIAFPTLIFLGRDGHVRRVHAGFYGPATGEQYARLVRELERLIERLLR